jgi:NOL1/NOP2/sun family putative RNA methylase
LGNIEKPELDQIMDILVERYASILDDPEAFRAALQQPLPICIWVNPHKTTPEAMEAYLAANHIEFEPLGWYPHAFRTYNWEKPGTTLPSIAGWYQVQEEISLTAVRLLDPQPGDRVLDLCAAPGGKMAQIALQMGEDGVVFANEVQVPRLASLRTTIERTGLLNVVSTNQDGRFLEFSPHSFDRVLLDAPCSGEGTLRKRKPQARGGWRAGYSQYVASVQCQLLEKALQLVKPGGTIVYSTCTFAPEENEAVLDKVLGDRGYVEPAPIPELKAMPGLQCWQGQTFRQDIAYAQRYFPHFNNTGGFFVACIRRTDAQLQSSKEPSKVVPGGATSDRDGIRWFCDRFGCDEAIFHNKNAWVKSKEKIWLSAANCQPLQQPETQNIGISLLRVVRGEYKPTTFALQRFGCFFQRNVIELTDEQVVWHFLAGKSQPLKADVEPGYVHVRYGDFELGCGWYQNGTLRSQIPKSIRSPSGLLDPNAKSKKKS